MGIIHALSLLRLKGALHVIILKSLLFLPLRNYRSNEPRAPLLPDYVTQEIEHVQIRKWPFLAKPAAGISKPPDHVHEQSRAEGRKYSRNTGPGGRCYRGRGLAEEPENIAVLLLPSKRHLREIETTESTLKCIRGEND